MDLSQIGMRLSQSPATAIPLLFITGVLTSLTPCIYPMIPITAAIVGGQSVGRSTRRGVVLTLTYVFGLSLVYALLGLLAGLTRTLFGTVSASPWAAIATGNLLLLFGLWMLDAVPVRVPAFGGMSTTRRVMLLEHRWRQMSGRIECLVTPGIVRHVARRATVWPIAFLAA